MIRSCLCVFDANNGMSQDHELDEDMLRPKYELTSSLGHGTTFQLGASFPDECNDYFRGEVADFA